MSVALDGTGRIVLFSFYAGAEDERRPCCADRRGDTAAGLLDGRSRCDGDRRHDPADDEGGRAADQSEAAQRLIVAGHRLVVDSDGMSGFSLTDLAGLSKPATALIDAVSDAVGGIAKPWQMKRTARAEADAAIIRGKAEIELTDLQRRAQDRWLQEETAKQENIESITYGAIPDLKEGAKPEEIENDWLAYFYDRARLISDEEMQSLWSRLLAGEANAPGAFSRRTINLVSTLSKDDAELFTNLCSLVCSIETIKPITIDSPKYWHKICEPVIFDIHDEFYKDMGITIESMSHLEAIGLVYQLPKGRFVILGSDGRTTVDYFQYRLELETKSPISAQIILAGDIPRDNSHSVFTGNVSLTESGRELAAICGATPSEEIVNYFINEWSLSGLMVRTAK